MCFRKRGEGGKSCNRKSRAEENESLRVTVEEREEHALLKEFGGQI